MTSSNQPLTFGATSLSRRAGTGAVIGLLALNMSCDNNSVDRIGVLRSISSSLVFNTREVDQLRGEMLRSGAAPTFSQAQQAAYYRAHATSAVGMIAADACGDSDTHRSSGTLASVDRLTTAWHGIMAATEATVVFGGFEDGSGNLVEDGTVVGLPYADDAAYRLDLSEENPFLANRLFALSLNDWAKSTVSSLGIRESLRHWTFEPVMGTELGTWNGQGFMEFDGGNAWGGRDLAVLEATGTLDVVEAPSTGEFPLTKPGVFFDRLTFYSYNELTIDGELNLATVHSNVWPDNSGNCQGACRVPLVSRNGYAEPPLYNSSSAVVACGYECYFANLLDTTIDATASSSGGALIVPDQNEYIADGQDLIKRRYAAGVLTGQRYTGSSSGDWSDHTTTEEPNPDLSSDASIFTTIVGADLQIIESTHASPMFDPSDRVPCSNWENKPDCIQCLSFTANGDCADFSTVPATTKGETKIGIDWRGIPINDSQSSMIGNDRGRSVRCWFDANGKPWRSTVGGQKFPGVIVGFLGGMTEWDAVPTSTNPAIGTLLAICAPLSSTSYTENWQFLTLKGGRVAPGADSVGGRLGWGSLEDALEYAYELRRDFSGTDFVTHVRPVSMKMCPPNHAVTGTMWSTVGSGTYGPDHVVGLRYISCAPIGNNSIGTNGGNFSLVQPNNTQYSYTMAGQPFRLDQKIGNSLAITDAVGQVCQSSSAHPVANGIEMTHDGNGRLVQVYLTCGQNP